MKKILSILMILVSLTTFSQRVDTTNTNTINLHLDKYNFSCGCYQEPVWFVRPSTPYLYLTDRIRYPYSYEPTIYPLNFNPLGQKALITGGFKFYIFK